MTSQAQETWEALALPWQIAFSEAWASFGEGNLGIGAAVVEPDTSAVVSRGRNRVHQAGELQPDEIGGNFVAHAEMNALISLDRYKAGGLHLYTTLEPCMMCSATAVMMHVHTVHFAATDEMFSDVGELLEQHPYGRKRKTHRIGPLPTRLAGFARVLPLTVLTARMKPNTWVMTIAHEQQPEVAQLAAELAASRELQQLSEAGEPAERALATLWDRLTEAT